MPLYNFVCPNGHIHEIVRAIDVRNEPLRCHCGLETKRKLSTFNYSFGFTLSDESRWVKNKKDEFVRNI